MTDATSVETSVVDSGQFVEIVPSAALLQVDLDPTFGDLVPEAYLSAIVYIPSTAQPDIAASVGPTTIFSTDGFSVGIHYSGGDYHWYTGAGAGNDFALVAFDQWTQVEVHAVARVSSYDMRVDGTLYTALDSASLPTTGINFWAVGGLPAAWVGTGGGSAADDTIYVDELSWATNTWVSLGGVIVGRWAFDVEDPIVQAPIDYPDPPWAPDDGGDPGNLPVDPGGSDFLDIPPPALLAPASPDPEGPEVQVFIDDEDVTDCVRSGSVTRRLNRPWQASLQLFSDCAPGTACSKVKVFVGSTLWFHGFVTQISTQAGEDGTIISEYTCMDPMFLWQWRPARDPDGDFSNPSFFMTYIYGPQIMQVLLNSSEDTTAGGGGPPPQYAEGTTFIDLAGATYATGEQPMSGAPTDWPMTIAECFELMSSTGTLDAILTPIDTGGNMVSLAVYNGDYGTDRTASVFFDYATGNHNVRDIRWTEDGTNICNKLWYYLGPRVKGPRDPAGDQHWRANITGDDHHLYGNDLNPFGGEFPDGPVATHGPGGALPDRPAYSFPATLGQQIADSRASCGVRMEVRIYDAQGDENPAAYRWLYRRQWQQESWLRTQSRSLVHATPVRQSDNMQLPPGVTPVAVGAFDIGDLVTVTAGAIVRGGFSGAQRIYEYTVSWDENGVVEVGELLTSSDQEGSGGP